MDLAAALLASGREALTQIQVTVELAGRKEEHLKIKERIAPHTFHLLLFIFFFLLKCITDSNISFLQV